jgi:Immunoglobulin domain
MQEIKLESQNTALILQSTVCIQLSFKPTTFHRSDYCNLFPTINFLFLVFIFSNKNFLIFVFKVLPQIVPFSFGDEEFNLDESVMASCSITKGDLPIKIWWTFSGDGEELSHNLTTNDGVVISRNSQKISMLAIDAVKARHRGNYTCYGSNKGGFAQQSSYLAINGSI